MQKVFRLQFGENIEHLFMLKDRWDRAVGIEHVYMVLASDGLRNLTTEILTQMFYAVKISRMNDFLIPRGFNVGYSLDNFVDFVWRKQLIGPLIMFYMTLDDVPDFQLYEFHRSEITKLDAFDF